MSKSLKNFQTQANSAIWLIPILILGAAFRVYNLTAQALWHDEAFSAFYIRYPWQEMFHRIALDVHPPLYYIVLRFWHYIFGDSLLALRALSVIFGIATIYVGYLFVKEAFKNEKLAILAALFLAINPFQIAFSQEARMYSLGTFLILLASYIFIKALNSNKTSLWLWYAVIVAAGFYTHYFLLFSVAAHGLYLLYYMWKEKKLVMKGLSSYALSFVLFLPWVPTLLTQASRVQDNFWINAPDRYSISSSFWAMVFGGHGIDHLTLTIITPIALVILIYFFKRSQPEHRWLLTLSVLIPVILAMLLSFKQAIYLDRYFVFSSLFFTIMIAATFFLVDKYTTRRNLAVFFILISVVIFFKNWRDMGWNQKPGMKAASVFINDNARPDDKIYVGLSAVYFTFKYYNQTPIKPMLYSTGPFESIPHFSGTALLKPDDLITDFREAKKDETVWLLWTTGFYGTKPNVPGNWSVIDEKYYADSPWYKGDIIVTQYHIN